MWDKMMIIFKMFTSLAYHCVNSGTVYLCYVDKHLAQIASKSNSLLSLARCLIMPLIWLIRATSSCASKWPAPPLPLGDELDMSSSPKKLSLANFTARLCRDLISLPVTAAIMHSGEVRVGEPTFTGGSRYRSCWLWGQWLSLFWGVSCTRGGVVEWQAVC